MNTDPITRPRYLPRTPPVYLPPPRHFKTGWRWQSLAVVGFAFLFGVFSMVALVLWIGAAS